MADLVLPGASAGGPLNAGALPANYDIAIYKGDYLEFFVTINDTLGTPLNLTDYTVKAQLKTDYSDPSPILFNTTVVVPSEGYIRVFLSSSVTATLLPGSYIYDLQVTSSIGENRTYLRGDAVVQEDVTQ